MDGHTGIVELTPAVSTDPLRNLVRALQRGFFCERPAEVVVVPTNSFDQISSSSSHSSEFRERDENVSWIAEPVETVKRLLLGSGFCDPVFGTKENHGASRDRCESMLTTKSCETVDSMYYESQHDEDDLLETIVAYTHPGTNRLPRILHALEIFFSAIIILVATLYSLRETGFSIVSSSGDGKALISFT